jgi:hypothetical protein
MSIDPIDMTWVTSPIVSIVTPSANTAEISGIATDSREPKAISRPRRARPGC